MGLKEYYSEFSAMENQEDYYSEFKGMGKYNNQPNGEEWGVWHFVGIFALCAMMCGSFLLLNLVK